jgi:hypothetical protein
MLLFLPGLVIVDGCERDQKAYRPGLIGIYYSEPNLTSFKAIISLESLQQKWDETTDFITGSSGVWDGFIIAPEDGEITYSLESNKVAILEINQAYIAKTNKSVNEDRVRIPMKKGQAYPIKITFLNDGPYMDFGFFNVKWQWQGQDLSSIPAANIVHSKEHADKLGWLADPDPQTIDQNKFLRAPGKHVIVYHELGRFGAWPANNGIWIWENEILVGFLKAYHKENKYHHSIDRAKSSQSVLARSLDGGETWNLEDPDNFVGDGQDPVRLTKELNFEDSGFAIRCAGNGFFTSYSRGKSWEGPFLYTDFGIGEITTRTDYIVDDEKDCFLFLSSRDQSVKATLQDRSFCAHTTDGGKTFKFVSWMAETDTIRSVMSSTVRLSENHLVSAMRRRYDPPLHLKKELPKNYITVHQSLDNGRTWEYISKVAETDRGKRNGNPPSLVKLKNDRVCVTYGYRSIPYSIRARISSDQGKTWSKEIILRDDARTFDIGYTQSVVRTDGKIVTLYYYTTEEKKEQHIAATIWDPDLIKS